MVQTSTASKLNKKLLPPFALAAFGGAFVLYLIGIAMAGGSPLGFVLFLAAFALVVWLPGILICEKLAQGMPTPQKLLLALPAGAMLLLLSFVSLGRVLPVWLCGVPGGLLGLWWLAGSLKSKRLKGFSLGVLPQENWWLLLMLAISMALYLLTGVFGAAKPSAAGNMVYNQDLLWSVGNAAAVQWGAPLRDIRAAGGVLHYHYFADGLAGLLALMSGQSAWDAVCYFSWPVWCAAFIGGVYWVARGFGAGPRAALLPVVGALWGHFAWDVSFKHVFENVNGVVQSYVFLTAALLALQLAEATAFKNKGYFALLGMAVGALLWSKSTVGVLFVLALLAAGAAGLLFKKAASGWLLAAGAFGGAVFALLYLGIYSHAINNLIFKPSLHTLLDSFRILLGMYLPAVLLYLGSLWFSLKNIRNLSFAALAVNALVPGGMAAYILFYHYSFSQSYFLLAAGFAMWLCVGAVANRLMEKATAQKAVALVCAAGVAASLYFTLPVMRRGVQVALRTSALRPPFPPEAETVTPGDMAAARWLHDNMAQDEVFATNRNAKNPDAQEGVFHFYTAASQRQAFVEGWRYAMDYSIDYHLLRHNLEVVSDGIFKAADFETARTLAKENGISYLLLWLGPGVKPFEGAKPVFSDGTVVIYKV